MRAGDYSTLYQWGVAAKSAATSFGGGQSVAYTASGTLWGTPAETIAAGRQTILESEQQVTNATIRIRNYPTIKPQDRLTDPLGVVWIVKTWHRGENEIVCDVEIDR